MKRKGCDRECRDEVREGVVKYGEAWSVVKRAWGSVGLLWVVRAKRTGVTINLTCMWSTSPSNNINNNNKDLDCLNSLIGDSIDIGLSRGWTFSTFLTATSASLPFTILVRFVVIFSFHLHLLSKAWLISSTQALHVLYLPGHHHYRVLLLAYRFVVPWDT